MMFNREIYMYWPGSSNIRGRQFPYSKIPVLIQDVDMDTWWTLSLWLSLASWYQINEACDLYGTCLQPPAFISNFTTMRAQSDADSSLTIYHGLGEVPVKVEVQVRPSPGRPDTDYVFPGLGSAQADDDLPQAYGGVVYKYNAHSVMLAVPKKNNGAATGTVIYTGGNVWIGPKSQKENVAEVRVKVWTKCSFPAPDFESNWIHVVSRNATYSYRELEHRLADDPEYVSVQIKNPDKDWYSDGIGSSTRRHSTSAQWGGVIYGTDKMHVRIWVPHLKGNVFFATDGWGIDGSWTSGLVKVRVWRSFGGLMVYNSTTPINSGLNPAGHQLDTPYLDVESGMIDVQVKAIDGLNSGFYFPASGAVQNIEPSERYGGVVYSYSEFGVRFWNPHLSPTGNYLVYIDSYWGGGKNPQASAYGDLVIRYWNLTKDETLSIGPLCSTEIYVKAIHRLCECWPL